MMIAHLIIAHTNPKQIERLIGRLVCAKSHIYIHVDKKSKIDDFIYLKTRPNVYFIENRIRVTWGAYSMVQTTLKSMEQILASKMEYSHINLLSGQDYPLKNPNEICDFFLANSDKTFMKFLSINDHWKEALPRLHNYHLTNHNYPLKYRVQYLINKILPKRKMPANLKPFGLSQWFTITSLHAKYVIDYLKENKNVERFFSMTWGADEFVFQTILLNSEYRNNIENNYRRFIKFEAGATRPMILTLNDVDSLLMSGKFYARKFDDNIDNEVLNYLDSVISIN